MRIFGARSFAPLAIITEKVSESTFHGIERVFQERQIPEGRICFPELFLARLLLSLLLLAVLLLAVLLLTLQLFQQHCENECAGVVVRGIALTVVRGCEDRVLQHSSISGQPMQVIQFQSRELIPRFEGNAGRELDLWI